MGDHKNKTFGISTGKVGAISELLVCADLLKKGWEIFRSVSQACSCDVVAIKNGKIKTFEVRTGRYKSQNVSTKIFTNYKYLFPTGNLSNISFPKDHMKSDYFAVVTLIDDKVHFEPELKD